MKRVLGRRFFERDALLVAEGLLGKFLVRNDGGRTARMITEVEAYDGPDDLASHASKGETARTAVMFGEAGRAYVYLIYGMHHMLNVVTGPVGYPAAVLIRGVSGVSGPGRVAKAFGVDKRLNAMPLDMTTGLWIEDRGAGADRACILRTARIGVDYAGPDWSTRPYRFLLERK